MGSFAAAAVGMPRALFQDPERKKWLMKKGPEARQKAKLAGREAKARMSCIWRSPGVKTSGDDGMNEGGYVCLFREILTDPLAGLLRQTDQLDLLEAAKGRIPTFLRWRADRWDNEA
jgi:hypothetical protein